MSSALGPQPLPGCSAVDNASDDIPAEGSVSADAVTTLAAAACDPDDALSRRCSARARRSPPDSHRTRCHARPAVYFP